MSNNEHHANALEGLYDLHERISAGNIPATEAVALAAIQAQATLAVAYEQRTANLIKVYGHGQWAGAEKVLEELKERLDLQ